MAKKSKKAPVKTDEALSAYIKRPFDKLFDMAVQYGSVETNGRRFDFESSKSYYNGLFNGWLTDHRQWDGSDEKRYDELLTKENWMAFIQSMNDDAALKRSDFEKVKKSWAPASDDARSYRVDALVIFYSRKPKPTKKENASLSKLFNRISKAKYRQGEGIAKNDIQRYINDHESCGRTLRREGNQKAISHWEDDRSILQKRFIDYYPE